MDLFVYLFNYFIESVLFFLLLWGYSEVVRSGSSARRDPDPVDLANHADETLLSSRSPSASVKSHLGAEWGARLPCYFAATVSSLPVCFPPLWMCVFTVRARVCACVCYRSTSLCLPPSLPSSPLYFPPCPWGLEGVFCRSSACDKSLDRAKKKKKRALEL